MPSSKIIKAATQDLPISPFSFRQVTQSPLAVASQPTADDGARFVPLEIFDPTEIGSKVGLAPPQPAVETPPEVPGRFVSDQELEKELQESYQRGLQDGKNLAERGLVHVFKAMRTASEELQQQREKVLRDSEEDLLALAIAVARQVIHQEVMQDRGIVLRVIKAALETLSDNDELVIRVHPDDYALLTTSQNQALQQELASFRYTLKADTTIPPGCCQVDTTRGTVDASFEAQLEELYRRMREERASGAEPLAEEHRVRE